jgi:cell division protein FtsZ
MIVSVPLEHAAGIIANFTGGPDLTLFEVEEALTRLQEQTSSQTEIVLGIINDDRLEGRAQVTLIVTGLGAPTLEEALSTVAKHQPLEAKPLPMPAAPPPIATQPATRTINFTTSEPTISSPSSPLKATPNPNDIDLPAFLRRRVRYAG